MVKPVLPRRSFLKGSLGATAAAGALAVASPAIAQSSPQLRWRMTSSFTRALDVTFGAGELLCRYVSELTEGKFVITQYAAGEIVPGLGALQAVSAGTVEMCHTPSLFYIGLDPAFALGAAVPFMMNPRQQHAWMYYGGGNELLNEFYRTHGVYGLACGNTGNQWGGWFRNEIKSLADIQGLRMRVAGLAGQIMRRVGVVPQQIAPGDIYVALERGTIDAAEYIGPYDDEKLGFQRIAKNYYFPGWAEGGTVFHSFINLAKYQELPKTYQVALEVAAKAATTAMLANYDAKNPEALSRLLASGVNLRAFPNEVLDAFFTASQEHYAELSRTNAAFRTLLESQVAFRDRNYAYHQVADFQFDAMMLRLRRRA